jgi:F0F1-type ATP synthase assembly protein I
MKDPETKKMWAQAASASSVGLEIAASIVIGYLGGRYLDRTFGTSPWLMYLGFTAGIGAAIKALVRVVREYQRANPEDPPKSDDEQQSVRRD